jgi:hypothetical protein
MTPAEKLAVKTAQAFIEQHESDAHWARGPQERAEHLELAETLRTLVEALENAETTLAEDLKYQRKLETDLAAWEAADTEYAIEKAYSAEGTRSYEAMPSRAHALSYVRPWQERTPWSQRPVQRSVTAWEGIDRTAIEEDIHDGVLKLDPKPYVTPKGVRYEVGDLIFSADRPMFLPREKYVQDIAYYPDARYHRDPQPWRWGKQRFEDADPAGQDFDFAPEWDPRDGYEKDLEKYPHA